MRTHRGTDGVRTRDLRFTRPTPYHLATAPDGLAAAARKQWKAAVCGPRGLGAPPSPRARSAGAAPFPWSPSRAPAPGGPGVPDQPCPAYRAARRGAPCRRFHVLLRSRYLLPTQANQHSINRKYGATLGKVPPSGSRLPRI